MKNLQVMECTIRMPLMSLPVRSMIVTLANAKVLISPGSELSEEQYAQLESITDIVAPNLLHCAGIPKAAEKFPEARVWGVSGAKEHRPKMSWTHVLTAESWPFQEELPVIALAGMPKVNEAVFVHRESSTLIATDFVFNLVRASGLGAWIILNLFGTYRKFGVSKFYAKFVSDKAVFEKSLGRLLAFEFENIVMSHGDVVKGGGKALLLQALRERSLQPR